MNRTIALLTALSVIITLALLLSGACAVIKPVPLDTQEKVFLTHELGELENGKHVATIFVENESHNELSVRFDCGNFIDGYRFQTVKVPGKGFVQTSFVYNPKLRWGDGFNCNIRAVEWP